MDALKVQVPFTAYQGKRVFVTGDTGFKGSWLCHWLTLLGAQVSGYALAPERPTDHFVLSQLEKKISHLTADVRDYERLNQAIRESKPEIIFHLAAQPLVHRSYESPRETFETNLLGGVNVLEAVRQNPSVQALVFVTSDKCYLNKEWLWGYRENDELGGKDPYSGSKAAAELVFHSYVSSFFEKQTRQGLATVRAGNVIGGGDASPNRIVPDCIQALRENRPIVLRNPLSTRPWFHVLDALSGYLTLGARLLESPTEFGGSWNFGPDERSKTVQELTEAIAHHWGPARVEVVPHSFAEAGLLRLNCDKAKQRLQWKPTWEFAQATQHTAQWYKSVHGGKPAIDVTHQQIRSYMEDFNDSRR